MTKNERLTLPIDELEQYYQQLRLFYKDKKMNHSKIKCQHVVLAVLQPILKAYFDTKYDVHIHQSNKLISREGVVIVSNHVSHKDIALIAAYLKKLKWHVIVKEEVKNKAYGCLFRMTGSIFVDRSCRNSRKDATSSLSELLAKENNVLIFPEGHINNKPDHLMDFSMSPVYLSQSLDKYILPIAITVGKKQIQLSVSEQYKLNSGQDLITENRKLKGIIENMLHRHL